MEHRNDGTVLAVLSVLSVLVLAYSLLVAQQILLGLLIVMFLGFAYVFWRFIDVLERIATALEARVEQDSNDSRR